MHNDREEEIRIGILFSESPTLKEYQLLVGETFAKLHPLESLRKATITAVLSSLNNKRNFRNTFLRRYILPSIQQPTKVLVCNSQNFFGRFTHFHGFTGTPKGELALKLSVKKTAGTDGQVISCIAKNSREKLIILEDNATQEAKLKQLISQSEQEKFHALIDAGALFKDLPPKRSAEIILAS